MPIPVQSASSTPSATSTIQKGKGRAPQERELPLRKQFLMQQYKQVLTNSPLVVFLKPSDFSIEEITRLRVDLSLIKSSSNKASSTKEEDINEIRNSKPQFLYMRAGLLPPLFEQMDTIKATPLLDHLKQNGSNIAALTFPSLDPPSLKAALKAINKLSKTPNARKAKAAAAAKAAAGKSKGPAAPAVQEERLKIITALVEGESTDIEALKKLSELPSLEQTLAQLVALIETPARQIYSMVSRAQGQDLIRTLEGFRVGLEEKEKPAEGKPTDA